MLIFNWKGLIDTWWPCKKKNQEVLEAPKFEKDRNCKDYSRLDDLKLRDATFNLVQSVSIIYPLEDSSIEICLLHEKVKWWMVDPIFLPKVKHDCLHGQKRGRRQTWAKHKDKGSFGCHDLPPLCWLWMVQVGKVDMTKFTKCKLRTLIRCLHTLSLLAKS